MIKKGFCYLHQPKDELWDLADELGLSEIARDGFFPAYEIKINFMVDMETGHTELTGIDDIPLDKTKKIV